MTAYLTCTPQLALWNIPNWAIRSSPLDDLTANPDEQLWWAAELQIQNGRPPAVALRVGR